MINHTAPITIGGIACRLYQYGDPYVYPYSQKLVVKPEMGEEAYPLAATVLESIHQKVIKGEYRFISLERTNAPLQDSYMLEAPIDIAGPGSAAASGKLLTHDVLAGLCQTLAKDIPDSEALNKRRKQLHAMKLVEARQQRWGRACSETATVRKAAEKAAEQFIADELHIALTPEQQKMLSRGMGTAIISAHVNPESLHVQGRASF